MGEKGTKVLLDPDAVVAPVDGLQLFGRTCPLEIDLGCGNGQFLLDYGRTFPEVGLLGVERARVYGEKGAKRAVNLGIENIRVAVVAAEQVLFEWLAPGSVHGVHMYFPDPWPKRRHHRRRMLQPAVAFRIAEVLCPGGLLRIKTDHAEKAAWMTEVLAGVPDLEKVDEEKAFEGLPVTNFEIRYGRKYGMVRFAMKRRET